MEQKDFCKDCKYYKNEECKKGIKPKGSYGNSIYCKRKRVEEERNER